jgi:peptidoglycan/LPS O-acetylase OafA/YrhL
MSTSAPIAAFSSGRDNNFTLARFLAASLVIFTHAFGVTGYGQFEPIRALYGVSAGTWAVDVFFVMSGFLVTKSYDGRRSLAAFLYARFMRVYPGMWACVGVCALCVGPLFTTHDLRDYVTDFGTLKFVVANSTLLPWGVVTGLPGVFETNRVPGVNVSLWTLPYELHMYLGVALLGVTGLLFRRFVVPVAFALTSLLYLVVLRDAEGASAAYSRLAFFFASGAALYHWRHSVALSWVWAGSLLAMLGAVLLVPSVETRQLALAIATPYLVIFFAFVPSGLIRRFNRLGDYSYGLYVYAFPVQQALAAVFPGHGPMLNMVVSMVGTLAFAIPSWHYVEKPALARKMPARWQPRRVAAPPGALTDPGTPGQ